jgi:hypothetical protein
MPEQDGVGRRVVLLNRIDTERNPLGNLRLRPQLSKGFRFALFGTVHRFFINPAFAPPCLHFVSIYASLLYSGKISLSPSLP